MPGEHVGMPVSCIWHACTFHCVFGALLGGVASLAFVYSTVSSWHCCNLMLQHPYIACHALAYRPATGQIHRISDSRCNFDSVGVLQDLGASTNIQKGAAAATETSAGPAAPAAQRPTLVQQHRQQSGPCMPSPATHAGDSCASTAPGTIPPLELFAAFRASIVQKLCMALTMKSLHIPS